MAADDVFLPLQPHFLALHGLSKLLKTIGLVNERLNDRLQLAGVVLCLYESGTKLAAEITNDVDLFFKEARKGGKAWGAVRLFETRIRRNIRLAESPSFGQSIFAYAGKSPGAEDYGGARRRSACVLRWPADAGSGGGVGPLTTSQSNNHDGTTDTTLIRVLSFLVVFVAPSW